MEEEETEEVGATGGCFPYSDLSGFYPNIWLPVFIDKESFVKASNVSLLSFTLVPYTGSSQSISYLVFRGNILKWIMASSDLWVTLSFS